MRTSEVVPLPYYPPSEFVLLEQQLREEMIRLLALPEHILNPERTSTAQEILSICRMKRRTKWSSLD